MKNCAFIFATLALAVATPFGHADDVAAVRVVAGDITDDRKSDEKLGYSSLALRLIVESDEIARARNVRTYVISATDENGKSLNNARFFVPEWREISVELAIKLDSPARTSKTLAEVTGAIELYDPTRNPQATVIVTDIRSQTGRTLSDATLKTAEIEIASLDQPQLENYRKSMANKTGGNPDLDPQLKSLSKFLFKISEKLSVDEKHLALRVFDPKVRVVDIGLETADGRTIESTKEGEIREFDSSQRVVIYGFKNEIPTGARLKIYVATPASVTEIPFQLSAIPLP